jgi:hypothetical protein
MIAPSYGDGTCEKKSVPTESPADDGAQMLTISPEKVCFIGMTGAG